MPGLFERALIEGLLLIVVIVCLVLAVMAIRKGSRRPASPEAPAPLNAEQLAHFDELLEQRDAEVRQRHQAEQQRPRRGRPRP